MVVTLNISFLILRVLVSHQITIKRLLASINLVMSFIYIVTPNPCLVSEESNMTRLHRYDRLYAQ